ncbi:MAG: tRNA dihydrouridine(20/20a) synthase DusA [Luminiphilus sp.]|nr:tRNA dihydrouridine(20/20a) synthase DusA [Luminiphilus sp.]
MTDLNSRSAQRTKQLGPAQGGHSPWRFSTAPCMDWTDRHCRRFWRTLTRHTRVYTEMVTTGALLHGDIKRHLRFNSDEHPVALQLGGAVPADLAACAKLGEQWGYDEINLNCGCPSDRVQNGRFGACLMAEPALVRNCVAAMREACDIPVTVKHRIGIDHQECYSELLNFVGTVASGGAEVFLVHARKAWLQGLSPKENRDIPPLNYEWVYHLKRDFPALTIVINGGIETLDACAPHLEHVDGVMLGRAPYQNPWLLSEVDTRLFSAGDAHVESREAAVEAMLPYIESQLSAGARLHHVTRHMLGLYQGQYGGRQYRRHLSEHAHKLESGANILLEAMAFCQTPPGRVVATG